MGKKSIFPPLLIGRSNVSHRSSSVVYVTRDILALIVPSMNVPLEMIQ